MIQNYRHFEATDPFGRAWTAELRWLQTGISIRHADTVDVKWYLQEPESTIEKVIALPHPLLLELSKDRSVTLSDPWCMKLAAFYLKKMIETWQDMDKVLVTLTRTEMEEAADEVDAAENQRKEALLANY